MGEASPSSCSAVVVGPNRWLGINRGLLLKGGGGDGVGLILSGLCLPLDPKEGGGLGEGQA